MQQRSHNSILQINWTLASRARGVNPSSPHSDSLPYTRARKVGHHWIHPFNSALWIILDRAGIAKWKACVSLRAPCDEKGSSSARNSSLTNSHFANLIKMENSLHVISRKKLLEAVARYPELAGPLDSGIASRNRQAGAA